MQNKYTKQLIIIDKDTGEVLQEVPMKSTECVDIVDYRKKLNDNQKKHLQDKNNLKQFNHEMGGFVVLYYNNLIYNGDLNLDMATITRVIYLATYIDYNTNILISNNGYASGKKIIPMTKKDIKNIMRLSVGGFNEFFNTLIDKKILIENSDKTFTISNKYFTKGDNINKKEDYTRVYIDTIRELYINTQARQHKTLAYTFRLIEKVDFKTNIICKNPNDKYNKPEKMGLKDIGEYLKINTEKKNLNKFKNSLYKININRDGKKYYIFKRIIIESGAGSNDYFIINPMLFYRGNDYSTVCDIIKTLYIEG